MTEDRHKEEGRAHLKTARPEDQSKEWKVYVSDEGEQVNSGRTSAWVGVAVLFGVLLIVCLTILAAIWIIWN